MHPQLTLAVAELHRQDLLREAEWDRLAKRTPLARRSTPRWRQATGRVIDLASHALEDAALRMDPSVHCTERRLDPAH